MSILKNETPILEFDDDPNAVIQPDHQAHLVHLPREAVLAFLSDEIDRYAKAHDGEVVGLF